MTDIRTFRKLVFRRKNALRLLLSFCRRLLGAKHAGIMFGTDDTGEKFVPPQKWDRAVMHKFDGSGVKGMALKTFGPAWVSLLGLSPVRMYTFDPFGEKLENDGVIAHVVRKQKDYYDKGIKVLIIDTIPSDVINGASAVHLPVLSYDGSRFDALADVRVNLNIVRRFRADNFVAAFIPDYGVIVFNTVDPALLEKRNERYVNQRVLKQKLNLLIEAIETASLAYLGTAKGRAAMKMIWRKERNLRQTVSRLKQQAIELNEQKTYLQAVGGVTYDQLNMGPVNISDGVYAFLDMKGSAGIRSQLSPRDFFLVLTLCHEIAAETAVAFGCRVDNFLGDGMFLENVSVFDLPGRKAPADFQERAMIMVVALASIFSQIQMLVKGNHPMDQSKTVQRILKKQNLSIVFRAGMEWGPALIGPLGSSKRRIVTAIGEAVNIASRLESTGTGNCIHITRNVLALLKTSTVDENSCLGRSLRSHHRIMGQTDRPEQRDGASFFPYFKHLFGLNGNPIQTRHQVVYKEFIRDTTYLIRCMRASSDTQSVCTGI